MKDLVDEMESTRRPSTLQKKKPIPRHEMSLGSLTIGPRKIPPGAKFITVPGTKPKEPIQSKQQKRGPVTELEKLVLEQHEDKISTNNKESGMQETKTQPARKFSQEEKSALKPAWMPEKNTKPKKEEDTKEEETLKGFSPESDLSVEIQPLASTPKSFSSKEVVLEVVNSLNASEKRLIECIDSQTSGQPDRSIKLMDPHRAHTVIEATKGILVGMKLKLDAAKMLAENE